MILRLFGIGILIFFLFFGFLFSLLFFCLRPFGWFVPDGWLLLLLLVGFGIFLLVQNRRTGLLAFGLTLVFAGFAFLSNNLWGFNLFQFWPVLLILWGLALILQRRAAE